MSERPTDAMARHFGVDPDGLAEHVAEVAERNRQRDYDAALGSFVDQTKRLAKVERELADVKAENARLRDGVRALVVEMRTTGLGQAIHWAETVIDGAG